MTLPQLVFGWGNRSRGDDALGPLCVERLRSELPARDDIEYLDDYQLMVEHVLDLHGRSRVLFVDASLGCAPPFESLALHAAADGSISSPFLELFGRSSRATGMEAERSNRPTAAQQLHRQALWCQAPHVPAVIALFTHPDVG